MDLHVFAMNLVRMPTWKTQMLKPRKAANGFDRAVDWDWEVRYVHETLGIHETGVAALEVLRLMGRNSQPSNFFLDSRNRRKTNDKDFKHQVLISGFDPIQEKSTRHKTRSAPKVQTRFTCTFQCHPTTEDLWECLILRSLHVQSNTFNIQQEGWDGRAVWPECCWPWLALGRQAPARRWQDRPKWNNCDVSVTRCPC